MINYLKSEHYRLLRKKGLYFTTGIAYLLITLAAIVIYYTEQHDPSFPYATSSFFYSNVIGTGLLLIIISFIYNLTLTGKDTALIKQSVAFGISRHIIFWSKLILTLGYFLLVCTIGILLVIVLGETFMTTEQHSIKNFLTATLNMTPIILSGFFLIHTLKMLKIADVYIVVALLFIFGFADGLLRLLFRPITGLNELYKYAPNTLLNENLMNFMNDTAQLGYQYWITGIIISGLALFFGARRFAKQNID